MSGAQRRLPTLRLGIDANRRGAGSGDAGAGLAFTEHAGEAVTCAAADDAVGLPHAEDARSAIA
jgi:hypothetical protein